MTNRSDHHSVRRVVLPSGKTIEVVYFEDAAPGVTPPAPPAEAPAQRDGEPTGLHVCPACSSPLVHPVDWEEAGPDHWEMTLACPCCEWSGDGVFDQDTVDRFEDELDRGTEALVRDLKRLMHANMEDEIERFARALWADQILPMDF